MRAIFLRGPVRTLQTNSTTKPLKQTECIHILVYIYILVYWKLRFEAPNQNAKWWLSTVERWRLPGIANKLRWRTQCGGMIQKVPMPEKLASPYYRWTRGYWKRAVKECDKRYRKKLRPYSIVIWERMWDKVVPTLLALSNILWSRFNVFPRAIWI